MAQTLPRGLAAREKCYWAITLKGGDDELIGRIDSGPTTASASSGKPGSTPTTGAADHDRGRPSWRPSTPLTLADGRTWLGNAEANTAASACVSRALS